MLSISPRKMTIPYVLSGEDKYFCDMNRKQTYFCKIINVSAPKQDSQMVSLPRVQEMALMQADSQSASYTRGWQGRADKNQHFSSTEQKDILHSSTCSASPVSWLHTQRTRDVTELSHYSENQHTAVCRSLEWDDPNSPARPAFDYCLDKTQASVPSSPKTIYLMQML